MNSAILSVALAVVGVANPMTAQVSGTPPGSKEKPAKTAEKPKQDKKPQDPRKLAPPKNAAELFESFRGMTGLEAKFEEKKYLALLEVPLQSSGVLYFNPPGHLSRQVLKPERSTVTITPNELRVEHRDGKEVIDLKASAEMRQFVTSLVQVFRGDDSTLAKSYGIRFTADPKRARHWSLELKPKGDPLAKMIQSLTLAGEGQAITSIEMLQPKGDRTVTRILEANPARRFSTEERKRLFGIAPK